VSRKQRVSRRRESLWGGVNLVCVRFHTTTCHTHAHTHTHTHKHTHNNNTHTVDGWQVREEKNEDVLERVAAICALGGGCVGLREKEDGLFEGKVCRNSAHR
jgi:hypothetical protein